MPLQTHRTTVNESQTGRADHLVRDLTGLSRSKTLRLFQNKCVHVNGKTRLDSFFRLNEGDVVEIKFDPSAGYPEVKKAWEDRSFEIVFEDSWILVVNKSAGTLTTPTEKHPTNSLLDRVKLYLNHSRRNRDCYVIHRLDRAVSGLLVFAKTSVAADLLQAQFSDNAPVRKFTAIVNGNMNPPTGRFESYLATTSSLNQYSVAHAADGQQAITDYRVITEKLDTTVVELVPQTARRHQIRVHLAESGHPILGDPRYGEKRARHRNWNKRRIALHGHQLDFAHPENGEVLSFTTPIPRAIKKFRPQPIEDDRPPR